MNSKGPAVVYTEGGQSSAASEAHLWVCSGQNIGRRFALDKPDMVIGRSSSADIPVIDERVSQQHAVIETRDEGHHLRDLGSTNGTFVNNQRVHEAALRDGDLLQVGETVFEYLSYQERNLTITVRGRTNNSEGVPTALRDEARQMLEQARVTPGHDSTQPVVPHASSNQTVDVPTQDPAATGAGGYMGTYVPVLQRPARDVNTAPVHGPGAHLPAPYMGHMPGPYPQHGMIPAPMPAGTVEERRVELAAAADGDDDEEGGVEFIVARLKAGRDTFVPYWKSVVFCLVAGLAAGVGYFKANPPARTAEFEIALQVSTQPNPLHKYVGRLGEFFVGAELAFRTPALIEKTLIELGHESPSPEFLNAVKRNLELVSAGPPTPNTYTGAYKHTDPDWALSFLETHVNLYLESEVEKALKVLKVEAGFMQEQVEEVEKRLRRSEAELMEFKKKNLEGDPEQAGATYMRLVTLRMDESEAMMNLQKARKTRAMLQGRLRTEQPLVKTKQRFDNHYKAALSQMQLQLITEKANGKGPDHPDVIKLEKRLAELQLKSEQAKEDPTSFETTRNPVHTQIQNEERNLQIQEQLAEQQLAYIRRELAKTEATVSRLPELEAERSDLMRSYQTTSQQYDKLLQQLQIIQVQLNLERASTAARYNVISDPHLVYIDKKAKMIMFAVVGAFMGLFFGILLTIIRHLAKQGAFAALRELFKSEPKAEAVVPVSDSTALAPHDPAGPLGPPR